VKVGSGDKACVFGVQENLICEHFFLQAALNGTWKESVDQIVELPDDEAKRSSFILIGCIEIFSSARRRAIGKKKIENI